MWDRIYGHCKRCGGAIFFDSTFVRQGRFFCLSCGREPYKIRVTLEKPDGAYRAARPRIMGDDNYQRKSRSRRRFYKR